MSKYVVQSGLAQLLEDGYTYILHESGVEGKPRRFKFDLRRVAAVESRMYGTAPPYALTGAWWIKVNLLNDTPLMIAHGERDVHYRELNELNHAFENYGRFK